MTPPHAAVDAKLLAALRDAMGSGGWLDAPDDMAPYLREQRGRMESHAAMVVRPQNTDMVARVMRLCFDANVPVYPQGGNTGLVGGAVGQGGIILSLDRMDRVRDVDAINHSMCVEAGCILSNVQQTARDHGLLFPLSLAAEGSCHIGGNLATNAGGVQVLRYGNTRELVLGIEVVLADGTIWNGLRGLRKDNAGYDLKQVFIGSEGTLGIITACVLKLFPAPRTTLTALMACPSVEACVTLLSQMQASFGEVLTAFEMMPMRAVEMATQHIDGVRNPFNDNHPFFVLMELHSTRENDTLQDALETALTPAMETELVTDAVIATSGQQADSLWRLRESIPEAQKHEGTSIKHDVSVPISRLAAFYNQAMESVLAINPDIRPVVFGHLGDGNLHFNLSQPVGADGAAFLNEAPRFHAAIHNLCAEMAGSFAAEHGVGILKREELARLRPAAEVEMMRTLKQSFDPKGILNPGKIID